jgi:hypothetical protein
MFFLTNSLNTLHKVCKNDELIKKKIKFPLLQSKTKEINPLQNIKTKTFPYSSKKNTINIINIKNTGNFIIIITQKKVLRSANFILIKNQT